MVENSLKAKISQICVRQKYDDINSAVKAGDVGVVRAFLKQGAQPDKPRENGDFNTPLHVAAFCKNFEVFKILFENLPPERKIKALNHPNRNGLTPLHEACILPEKMSPQMIAEMPKLITFMLYHGANSEMPAFVNGQCEYLGKIQYCTPLQTLLLQENDYAQGTLEKKTLQKCQNLLKSFDRLKSLSPISFHQLNH